MSSDRYAYFYASGSNLNVTVKDGPGVLHAVIMGQCSTSGNGNIIDGSGSVGRVISTLGMLDSAPYAGSIVLDINFSALSVQFGSFAGVVTLIYK